MNDKELKELLLERYDHYMKQLITGDSYRDYIDGLYNKIFEICDIMDSSRLISKGEYKTLVAILLDEYKEHMKKFKQKGE